MPLLFGHSSLEGLRSRGKKGKESRGGLRVKLLRLALIGCNSSTESLNGYEFVSTCSRSPL